MSKDLKFKMNVRFINGQNVQESFRPLKFVFYSEKTLVNVMEV